MTGKELFEPPKVTTINLDVSTVILIASTENYKAVDVDQFSDDD